MGEKEIREVLDRNVPKGLAQWQTPGLFVCVVKDGKTVISGGFGKRDGNHAIDRETLFPIGSGTKSFTAALAAMLVEEGKLDWDVPVREYVPEVRFYDEFTTSHVTVRDLLCHRSGLPRHEFSWYGTPFDREEILYNIRYLRPNCAFRTKMQYSNHGFILAGRVIERITGMTWEKNIEERIFKPLEMTRSTVFTGVYEKDDNRAIPYGRPDIRHSLEGMCEIPVYRSLAEQGDLGAPHGPAGSVVSCAADMEKWLQFQVTGKTPKGETLLSGSSLQEMHRTQMPMPVPMDMPQPEMTFTGYGLGWFVSCYRGQQFVEHGGNINGFASYTCMLPLLSLGIAICANMNACTYPRALARQIMDHYLGICDGNWSDRYYEAKKALECAPEEETEELRGERDLSIVPRCEFSEYAGTYHADGYSDFHIGYERGTLIAHYLGVEGKLLPYRGETFVLNGGFGELDYMTPLFFKEENASGKIEGFELPVVPEDLEHPIFFRKVEK